MGAGVGKVRVGYFVAMTKERVLGEASGLLGRRCAVLFARNHVVSDVVLVLLVALSVASQLRGIVTLTLRLG